VPLVAAARDVFVYFYNEWGADAGGEAPGIEDEPEPTEPETATQEGA
jgi:hypothetical protein